MIPTIFWNNYPVYTREHVLFRFQKIVRKHLRKKSIFQINCIGLDCNIAELDAPWMFSGEFSRIFRSSYFEPLMHNTRWKSCSKCQCNHLNFKSMNDLIFNITDHITRELRYKYWIWAYTRLLLFSRFGCSMFNGNKVMAWKIKRCY